MLTRSAMASMALPFMVACAFILTTSSITRAEEPSAMDQLEDAAGYSDAATQETQDENASQDAGWGVDTATAPDGYEAGSDDLQPNPMSVEPNE